jgi:actin-related protein 5
MSELVDEKILILKETKSVPEVFFDYTTKELKQPLIIDNGSCFARVGFGNKKTPQLIFRNLVAKPRKDRSKKDKEPKEEQEKQPETMIGNDIVNIEAMRFQLRTQFDRNIVTHYYLQEQIFDYIFTHLGINTKESVNHPIIITEALANPNYCRSCK